MGWAAEIERKNIVARTEAARARIEASGGKWGRPRRMSPLEVERARELKSEGRSVRAISVALKIPRATLARALREA